MPNEKVSQLVELGASELALNDLLLVTDTSAHESKKLQASSLLSFVQLTGSFLIINASSASYVPGGGVFGAVTSASFSDTSITSSYSLKVLTPVDTASYALYAEAFGGTISNAFTASYLSYTGFNNGTASFALVSQTANITSTASHLQYTPGIINGTASFSISASWSPQPTFPTSVMSSSWASSSISSSISQISLTSLTASYVSNNIFPVKAWAFVTWSVANAALPELYIAYNVSNIVYLGTVDPGSCGGCSGYYDKFGISFSSPLPSSNYIFIGNSHAGTTAGTYKISITSHTQMWPQETRSIYGFTMSINTANASDRNYFFGGNTFTSFEVLGL